MLKEEKIILNSISKDEIFRTIFEKLSINHSLDISESEYILACAILFLNKFETDTRFSSYADIAYYIILKYSINSNDYLPLYDFSINFGFYPIAKSILSNNLLNKNSIDDYFIETRLEKFKNGKGYIETLEQNLESKRFLNDISLEKSYLAPTSFGKSSLIVDCIKGASDKKQKIVIVVPTKSLLVQTHKMIREAGIGGKIIIHDEMYDNDDSFVAIFTQERALRLLNKHKNIFFDILFIDEAHNILKKESRSILLSRLIASNKYRNNNQHVIYLSPLIKDIQSLKIEESQSISTHKVCFNVKEPEIFEYRLNNKIFKYNRFVNQFYELGVGDNIFNYLEKNKKNKNFLYSYSPKKIELLASNLCSILPKIDTSEEITKLESILKREVHKDFYAIEYLKFGVIYLHGKLPDLIKEYLESKFKVLKEIKYVIANSVILEGMNLPIDCLFIFNTYSLKGKELMNLIGRVNRLNNIFSSDGVDLEKLLPNIYFLNSIDYNCKNSKMENKIKLLRNRIFDDIIGNPTLNLFNNKKIKISERQKIETIQKNELFLYHDYDEKKDSLKKYLIESGIVDFYNDIDAFINRFILISDSLNDEQKLNLTKMSVIDRIDYIFIDNVNIVSDLEFKRLKSKEARSYYEYYITVGQKKSLNENINSQFTHFKEKAVSHDKKLYIGSTYGRESYESYDYLNSKKKVYIDLSKCSDVDLVNLAIVKLKIEEDFISFKLNKFIVMLYDYNFISKDEYNLYIYGTIDKKKIDLTKYGLSISLISRLEKDKQLENLSFDEYNNLISNSDFNIFKNSVDDFYRFEINRYLG